MPFQILLPGLGKKVKFKKLHLVESFYLKTIYSPKIIYKYITCFIL